jgi:hypothetical protein
MKARIAAVTTEEVREFGKMQAAGDYTYPMWDFDEAGNAWADATRCGSGAHHNLNPRESRHEPVRGVCCQP